MTKLSIKNLPSVWIIFIGLGLIYSGTSHAAQDAFIATDGPAEVHKEASSDSQIVGKFEPKQKIRISTSAKSGWYRVKTEDGKLGWIRQNDLFLGEAVSRDSISGELAPTPTTPKAREHLKPPSFHIKAGGLFYALANSHVSKRLDLSSMTLYPSSGGFLELTYNFDEFTRIGIRGHLHRSASSQVFAGVAYRVEQSGMAAMLGLDRDFMNGEDWKVSLGLFLGPSLKNDLTVTTRSFNPPNSFTLNSMGIAALLNFGVRYHFTSAFSLVGDLGLYWSQTKNNQIPGPFGGDTPFRDPNMNLDQMPIAYIGPMIGLGVRVGL